MKIKAECATCEHWARNSFCTRISCGLPCVVPVSPRAEAPFNGTYSQRAGKNEMTDIKRLAEQEPDCWAVLTPNGSRLVSPEEAKGLLKAYPLFTAPPLPDTAPTEQGCAECGKKASEGWALYCVKCSEQIKDATLTENVERLAASQAREARLREAITVSLDTVGHAENARNILVNALSMPSDDGALDARRPK